MGNWLHRPKPTNATKHERLRKTLVGFFGTEREKEGYRLGKSESGLKKEGKGKKCRNHEDRLRDNIGEQV